MNRNAAALIVAAALSAAGCGGGEGSAPPSNARPEDAALALFSLGRQVVADGDDPARVVPFVDADAFDRDPGALFEALAELADVDRPRVVASEPLPGLERVAVDVEGERPGPRLAAFSVQVSPADDGTWRVVWFAGPETAWPPHRPPRDAGLATSPPPGED